MNDSLGKVTPLDFNWNILCDTPFCFVLFFIRLKNFLKSFITDCIVFGLEIVILNLRSNVTRKDRWV